MKSKANKAMLSITAIILLTVMASAPTITNNLNTVTSFETGGEAYDETLPWNEAPEEVIISYAEWQTGIEDLIQIYKTDIESGYDALLIPSSGEERYIKVTISNDDIKVTELQLQNVETEQIEEEVVWDCECSGTEENQVVQTLAGGEAITGELLFGGGRGLNIYTRSWYLKGVNVFGQKQWKNTAKGRFYFMSDHIIFVFDMSSTWTNGNWWTLWHNHYTEYDNGDYCGTVISKAKFKTQVWPIPAIYQCCKTYISVYCCADGSWDGTSDGECRIS